MDNKQFQQLIELNMRIQQSMQAQQQQQFVLNQQQNQIMQHNQMQMLQQQHLVRLQMLQLQQQQQMQQQQQNFLFMMACGSSGSRAILNSQPCSTGSIKMIENKPQEQSSNEKGTLPEVIEETKKEELSARPLKESTQEKAVIEVHEQTGVNKRKRPSSDGQEPSDRLLRSRVHKTVAAPVDKHCNLTSEDVIKELNEIPLNMKVQNSDQKELLRTEAENILKEINKDDCKQHLSRLVKGEIAVDERSGLGPFTLFFDLQETLFNTLDDISGECGANLKYQVLLPEAIIFGYCKLNNCERSVGVSLFEASSKLITEN